MKIKTKIVNVFKRVFGIEDMTLFLRRKRQNIEKWFYHQPYTADDIIECLRDSGVPTGVPIIIHSAMHNFYNYRGTAEELITKLIEFVGPEGTLCMPSFMFDRTNSAILFDVRNSPSAAGYLTEVFRKMPNVKRSLNHLHSVCAVGKDADLIVSEHHLSNICFDEHSPFYIIGQLGGYAVSLGMPKWYVGTGEHVCEALLFGKMKFFTDKFIEPVEFRYKDGCGNEKSHVMYTNTNRSYVRTHSTTLFDNHFSQSKYSRKKLSNIWVTAFEMKYLRERLYELAEQGLTIYTHPKFYN